jgi:hypothetical protein
MDLSLLLKAIAEVESFAQSDSGSDILGDDGAGRNHRWVEGVLKGGGGEHFIDP